ncbi:MAG: PAS domain-containing protein [Ruminococcaceae bacterium]|nr:PAS domain-containing protein [Oscillospiraceae bacterium]
MNEKIFRSSFLTSILVLVVSFVLIFGILFEYFEGQILSELKNEANYIAYAVKSEGVSYIDNFKGSDKRITLIAPDGVVLADTEKPVSELENHLQREEIREAQEKGWGSCARYSSTLAEKVDYYAIRLEDGSFLRVSTTRNAVWTILLGLVQPLIVIVLIIMGISFYLSYKLSNAIVKPINDLDLDNPSGNETYKELAPLLKKLSAQKRTIDGQIREARQKQEEFRLISENMSEGLLVIDAEGRVLTYNNAAFRLLEKDESKFKNILTFKQARTFSEVVESALQGARAEDDMESDERRYRLIANPVVEGEKTIGAVIMIIDITESAKREQLRREFTSNVSHELKTPLTSISGFAEIMKDGGTPEATVMDFSKSIYVEAQRLITLVSDIIRISELDEKTLPFEKEAVDIYALSGEIIGRLRNVAASRNIRMELLGESVMIFGIRKILDEMIHNLCDNAVKYNVDGGMVSVFVLKTEKGAVVSVKDTGIGIPSSEQDRVFERFYRVDKSHSRHLGGTGLGLSIVKHGAAYHNAEITLESTLGKGTEVRVEFVN